jgi:HD superfamily phosphohydrolase
MVEAVPESVDLPDRVYGHRRCTEPVLLDLLASAAVRRLAGIDQSGAGSLAFPAARQVSRLEHSVGVMLLLAELGASVEEQAAGLLHDIAHTAFSHVVDYALDRRGEDYHEEHAASFIARTDLPRILLRHGMVVDRVADLERWPLLDRPSPDLCADRIDYTLRDLTAAGLITPTDAQRFVSDLVIAEDHIACGSLAAARWFRDAYRLLIREVFQDPSLQDANATLAGALRRALDEQVVDEALLMTDDATVLERLRRSGDAEITGAVARLAPATADPAARRGHAVPNKIRDVDPSVVVAGRPRRMSELCAPGP